ncbi:MAG: competence/damage-inducible protein A [Lentimicrobiaceae bacterium]|nr:competence/damage-inducible protein A [Lentimicrobiaceae bacterium]
MEAEIISIGDELLIGQVVNTNAAWMAEQLNLIGIKVKQVTVIADVRQAILQTLAEATKRVSIVMLTGGLGPTNDDITKQTLCEYFDTHLVADEASYKNVETIFAMRGFRVTELNRKQAEVPANCIPIANLNGTAPGMWFEKNGIIYVSMPGVPFEMKLMMSDYILPELAKRFTSGAIVHKTILTQGMGESFLAVKIRHWEAALPSYIKLAYLPQPGLVRLRLTATGNDKESLTREIEKQTSTLLQLIPDLVFGFDDDTLEHVVGKLLMQKGKTISTAESCTGGYVAHMITGVPGSSAYFKGSVVAYANEVKEQLLGVQHQTLLQFGAVSQQCVIEMAEGARHIFNTDYAIATSGISGPDGGTIEKPVGTTWIAIATPKTTISEKFLFGEHRQRNIHKTALQALQILRKEVEKD